MVPPRQLIFGFVIAGGTLLSAKSKAQSDCDHIVEPSVLSITGDDLGVIPGQTVCIKAGAREFLRIASINGTSDAPVVIRNEGGQVLIDNSDRGYGLTLDSSSYVRITGTGDPNSFYGIRVRATRTGPDYSASCIALGGLSTDYEIDHIEASDCGFAGVIAKTDPSCETPDLSSFVQRNSVLHHLYLHDTEGEGIYFGSTGFPSRERICDGSPVDLVPHLHEGVWIYENIISDTGWDGLQVGASPRDCHIFSNSITRVGLSGELYQMQGLQVGGGSACVIRNNILTAGPAVGIIVLDAADTSIENNVVTGFMDGIYINDRDAEVSQGAQYRVLHNTVTEIVSRALSLFGTRTRNNAVLNNLIADGGESPLSIGADVDVSNRGNLVLPTIAEAFFTEVATFPFGLEAASPAIDAGVVEAGFVLETDARSAPRDESPDAGAFEYGATPSSDAPTTPRPQDGPGGSLRAEGGDHSEVGGCGCQMTTPASRSTLLITFTLLFLLFLRHRPSVG